MLKRPINSGYYWQRNVFKSNTFFLDGENKTTYPYFLPRPTRHASETSAISSANGHFCQWVEVETPPPPPPLASSSVALHRDDGWSIFLLFFPPRARALTKRTRPEKESATDRAEQREGVSHARARLSRRGHGRGPDSLPLGAGLAVA